MFAVHSSAHLKNEGRDRSHNSRGTLDSLVQRMDPRRWDPQQLRLGLLSLRALAPTRWSGRVRRREGQQRQRLSVSLTASARGCGGCGRKRVAERTARRLHDKRRRAPAYLPRASRPLSLLPVPVISRGPVDRPPMRRGDP